MLYYKKFWIKGFALSQGLKVSQWISGTVVIFSQLYCSATNSQVRLDWQEFWRNFTNLWKLLCQLFKILGFFLSLMWCLDLIVLYPERQEINGKYRKKCGIKLTSGKTSCKAKGNHITSEHLVWEADELLPQKFISDDCSTYGGWMYGAVF